MEQRTQLLLLDLDLTTIVVGKGVAEGFATLLDRSLHETIVAVELSAGGAGHPKIVATGGDVLRA
jgi:hypothetical protein